MTLSTRRGRCLLISATTAALLTDIITPVRYTCRKVYWMLPGGTLKKLFRFTHRGNFWITLPIVISGLGRFMYRMAGIIPGSRIILMACVWPLILAGTSIGSG